MEDDTGSSSTSISCKSLKKLSMKRCSLSANTLSCLLGCMPSVASLEVNTVDLIGKVSKYQSVSFRSVNELHVAGCHLETPIMLLGFMPSVKHVELRNSKAGFTTVMRFLGCFQSVTSLKLEGLTFKAIHFSDKLKSCTTLRDDFKTQPPVDRRFRPVPGGFYCLEQKQPPGTGRNRRSTGGWVLKPPLTDFIICDSVLSENASCKTLKDFEICNIELCENEFMRLLGSMPSVTSLSLRRVKLLSMNHQNMSEMRTSLTKLDIEDCKISSDTYKRLFGYTSLVNLDEVQPLSNETRIQAVSSGSQTTKVTVSDSWGFNTLKLMSALKYMTFATSVTLIGKVKNYIGASISCVSSRSEAQFNGFLDNSLTVNKVMEVLGCLPSIKYVRLHEVKIINKYYSSNVSTSCESVDEFHVVNVSWDASVLMQLFRCMPTVKSITLDGVKLAGEIDKNMPACFESVQEFYMSDGSMCSNAMIRMLTCSSFVATVTLNNIKLLGEIDGRVSISWVSCESQMKLKMSGSLSVSTLMRLISCIPAVTSVTFDRIKLSGDVDGNMISASCESVKEFNMCDSTLSASAMMRLLGCLARVTAVQLKKVTAIGEVDEQTSASCESLTIFKMEYGLLSPNTLIRLLCSMPLVTSVTLVVKLTGETDKGIAISNESQTDFKMSGSLRSNTMLRLLGCMPSVTSMKLTDIDLLGEVNVPISSCWSVTKFLIQNGSLSSSTMNQLLVCMPYVANVTLEEVQVTGEVISEIPLARCQFLTEFQMSGSLSASTMIRLLSCMPVLQSVKLTEVEIEGEACEKISPHGELLKKFKIWGGSVSANVMITLLSYLPSLT